MTSARCSCENRMLAWVERFLPSVPHHAGRVLDLACGMGRHSLLASVLGYEVLAVDRDADFAERAAGFPEIEFLQADLETGAWPLGNEKFAGIIVANYLHRPLFPQLLESLSPGGVLIYQTFTAPQAKMFGKPANPAHWLYPGELLKLVSPLSVAAFEEGRDVSGRFVQRICAVKTDVVFGCEEFPLRSA